MPTGTAHGCPCFRSNLQNIAVFIKKYPNRTFLRVQLGTTWWSRRELNSRLTRLPKGFLHAYAAFNLKKTSLRPKQPFRRNLKCRRPADFTSGQPFPACVDARFLPTGKRDGRAALIKQRTRTERSCCNLHCLHLNLGRMF